MDLPQFGILASLFVLVLATLASGGGWIDGGAAAPIVLAAVVVGVVSLVVLSTRRKPLTQRHELPPDDASWPCIACGYDVRHLPERCPECGTLVPPHRRPLDPRKLRENWPLSPIRPREPGDDESLLRVWDAPNSFAANLFVEQLRARGIKAVVRRHLPSMRVGEYVTPSADHAVFVYSEDADATSDVMTLLSRDVEPSRRDAEPVHHESTKT